MNPGVSGGASIRVLLVDDDPGVRDMLTDFLRVLGYQAVAVADGAEALARLTEAPCDLLLTDIMMPDMDGWQLIAAATQHQPTLCAVAMTGSEEPQEQDRAEALGVPLLRKPFTLDALRTTLQAATDA